MCGIVGLLIKKEPLRVHLGEWMVPMLIGMTERGPDSAGLAIFSTPLPTGQHKVSLYSGLTTEGADFNWTSMQHHAEETLGISSTIQHGDNHAILTFTGDPETVKHWIHKHYPALYILSTGCSIDLFKDVGTPAAVASRYQLDLLQGSHLVGHTRMATESAVSPDRAHPFTAGEDFCLVHNGSLSNPYGIRRMLESHGIHFDTDNDTEAACRFLEWRLREGDTLEEAIQKSFTELDGFFTLLMGTANQIALIRDPFACKPAIVAETDDYVAIASEFRSLAHLPDIHNAHIFEPAPEEMYVWRI